ncbi:MAG: DUF4251 domain-containing protein [Gemmatimonadaceae bacterium]|nr:DUF4251 domain-containing protein [Chitinophagaceae bacterium]
MKKSSIILSLFLMATLYISAQDSTSVEAMVNAKNFSFKPHTAMLLGGGVRQLTGGFELKVSKDKLIVYLPYFGRAYSAPLDPSRGALDFTSKSFLYEATERKKGGYDVIIRPKDGSDVQQMVLLISESGSASLQINSNNRQPISYNGVISR